MDKQEILEKARQENKGKDIADLDAAQRGTNIAFMVGGLTIIGVCIVYLIVTGSFPYGVMSGLFVMLAVAFLVKYHYLRKKHELVVGVAYALIAVGFAVIWILQLCKVI